MEPATAIGHGLLLLDRGAQIIDVGAESTRPGAEPLPQDEEWRRLAPVLGGLLQARPGCTLSVDTLSPWVAAKALEAGAKVINNVTGFGNPGMMDVAITGDCALIAVRSRLRGERIWMPDYSDPSPKDASEAVGELCAIRDRILGSGIDPERVALDPGFGFGTTYSEDCAIWESLPALPALLDWPIQRLCIGISRKRFIAQRFNVQSNEMLDNRTSQLHGDASLLGYHVFRTHSLAG